MTDSTTHPILIDEARNQTSAVLTRLPGGPALLAWMGGEPNFGDAEIIELRLNRRGSSALLLRVQKQSKTHCKFALVSFVLADMVDVQIDGFSHQNVIEGLTLRWAPDRPLHGSQIGVGLRPGDVEIELLPCFGAFGTIRATIMGISVEPLSSSEETP